MKLRALVFSLIIGLALIAIAVSEHALRAQLSQPQGATLAKADLQFCLPLKAAPPSPRLGPQKPVLHPDNSELT